MYREKIDDGDLKKEHLNPDGNFDDAGHETDLIAGQLSGNGIKRFIQQINQINIFNICQTDRTFRFHLLFIFPELIFATA